MNKASPTLDYLGVLRARKWVIFVTILVVPAVAVFFSLREQPLYQATATVLLQDQNPAGNVADIPNQVSSVAPDRFAQTQADVARSPAVIKQALAVAGVRDVSPTDLLNNSAVSSRSNADILDFQVTDPRPGMAVLLANDYAKQFVRYEGDLASSDIAASVAAVQRRITALSARGEQSGARYLTGKLQQLQAIQALQSPAAVFVAPATGAGKVQPQPIRSAILGLGLGLVLGIALAFLWDALDSRVRSVEEIGEQLRLPLLGRVPVLEGPQAVAHTMRLVSGPDDARLDAFRMLRVALDLVNRESPSRTIMVTSAVEGNEKSMAAVELALSFARAGRRVVLVDLDLRTLRLGRLLAVDMRHDRPRVVHTHAAKGGTTRTTRFLHGRPGLLDVALGQASLDDALVPIGVCNPDGNNRNGNGRGWGDGNLEFLASSEPLADAGEFLGSRTLTEILRELCDRAELVVIDAPPLLVTGDAFTLGARVDAVLLVARLNAIRRPMLSEIRRQLESCPAKKLGFVVAVPVPAESAPSASGSQLRLRSQRSQLRSRAASAPINERS